MSMYHVFTEDGVRVTSNARQLKILIKKGKLKSGVYTYRTKAVKKYYNQNRKKHYYTDPKDCFKVKYSFRVVGKDVLGIIGKQFNIQKEYKQVA